VKTAKEWQTRYWELRSGKIDVHHKEDKHNWDKLVEEIQDDAWQEGIQRAAHLLDLIGCQVSATYIREQLALTLKMRNELDERVEEKRKETK
jgi:hypothetical protein